MWTVSMTPPDITCVVRLVIRFCENPRLAQKKSVLNVMQYMIQRKEYGITYGGITYGGQGSRLNMEAYMDVDVWILPGC